jgi:hypothetical protein
MRGRFEQHARMAAPAVHPGERAGRAEMPDHAAGRHDIPAESVTDATSVGGLPGGRRMRPVHAFQRRGAKPPPAGAFSALQVPRAKGGPVRD